MEKMQNKDVGQSTQVSKQQYGWWENPFEAVSLKASETRRMK